MYDDMCWLVAPRRAQNGPSLLMMAKYSRVFLNSQYENGSDGILYKMELIYYPTSTTNGNPESFKRPLPDSVIGTDLRDLGDDKEAYRWNFILENQVGRDDYDRFIELCKVMGSSGARFEARVEDVLDVDEALRMYTVHSLCGATDTYMLGSNAHNLMFYLRPSDQRFVLFYWDQDFAWSRSPSTALWGGENLTKLLRIPRYQRLFYGHIEDIIETTYNTAYMSAWTDHYGRLAQETGSFNRVLNYIGQRRNFVRNRLPPRVAFAITTNDGADFTVDTGRVTIGGEGWVDVRTILVAAREDELLDVDWSTLSRWETTVPLRAGSNRLTFVALDYEGELIASDTIVVTSTAESPDPVFRRGDLNLDASVDISDVIGILFHLFNGRPIRCADAVDVDDDENLNVTDALFLLNHLFASGPVPPPPYREPGVDPSGDGTLDCAEGLKDV